MKTERPSLLSLPVGLLSLRTPLLVLSSLAVVSTHSHPSQPQPTSQVHDTLTGLRAPGCGTGPASQQAKKRNHKKPQRRPRCARHLHLSQCPRAGFFPRYQPSPRRTRPARMRSRRSLPASWGTREVVQSMRSERRSAAEATVKHGLWRTPPPARLSPR